MMASYQAKIKQIKQEKNKPNPASTAIPTLSVVKPLTELMSSVIMFVKIPGALFLLSNQPIFFLKNCGKKLNSQCKGQVFATTSEEILLEICRQADAQTKNHEVHSHHVSFVIVNLWVVASY